MRGGFNYPPGGGNATSLQGVPIDPTTPTNGQDLIFNGTAWVPGGGGGVTRFSASLSDALSSPLLIGSGTWKAIGAISFSASYSNGPATGGVVSMSGAGNTWSPNSLTLGSTFQGPTTNAQAVSYPTVDSTITFSLAATSALNSAAASVAHTFNNLIYWGISTTASGYVASDVTGLASNALASSRITNFTVNPGSGQYIIFAYPTRMGTATFTVQNFQGGFQDPETVSVTNSAGYTENYYVYRSTNSNLASTTVQVS